MTRFANQSQSPLIGAIVLTQAQRILYECCYYVSIPSDRGNRPDL